MGEGGKNDGRHAQRLGGGSVELLRRWGVGGLGVVQRRPNAERSGSKIAQVEEYVAGRIKKDRPEFIKKRPRFGGVFFKCRRVNIQTQPLPRRPRLTWPRVARQGWPSLPVSERARTK